MSKPLVIEDWSWEITRNCNQRCAHCIIGGQETGEMSTADALSVITKIVSLGGKRLHLTGGEPFVREDLLLLVNRAVTTGLSVNIITNGILQDAIIPFVKEGLIDQIGISIDGNETAHDLIRGHGSYRKTVLTIKAIVGAVLPVTVYLTINSLSIYCLGEVVSEMIELGVRSFHLNEINSEGRVKSNHYLEINGLDEKEKLEIISSQLDPLAEISDLSVDRSCTISPKIAYVDFKGHVYACTELARTNLTSMIAPLLDEDFTDRFRSYHSSIMKPDKCRYSLHSTSGMDICLNCAGSCPAMKGGLI